jgi:hypothetical protein
MTLEFKVNTTLLDERILSHYLKVSMLKHMLIFIHPLHVLNWYTILEALIC